MLALPGYVNSFKSSKLTFQSPCLWTLIAAYFQLSLQLVLEPCQICIKSADVFVHLESIKQTKKSDFHYRVHEVTQQHW